MKKEPKKQANTMWGGHYAQGPAAIMAKINACLEADKNLYREDIEASLAHAAMLARQKIIGEKEAKAIRRGLTQILAEIEEGRFVFSEALEDIHMNVESRLAALIGDAAGRLHTARSRNDQVATDLRLWVRRAVARADLAIKELQSALVAQAEENSETLMPGFTHLQPAQPVSFGHVLLAYAEMFARDRARFAAAKDRLEECPLGATALAGTSFPIDRRMTAKALGFSRPMANSLDAVSDRDFILDYIGAAAMTGLHLSRLAEEIILWSSDAFRFVKLSEAFTTGSSIMPQKRNPDAAELIRGKTATLIGLQTQVQTLVKGLPLAYNKDLQESKPPVFQAAGELEMMLAAATGMVRDMAAQKENMKAAAQRGFLTATDLADGLVRRFKMPFRQAHHVTGRIVRLAEEKRCRLDELSLAALQKIEPRLTREVFLWLDPARALRSRTSFGGTAPGCVKKQVVQWKKKLGLSSFLSSTHKESTP